VADDTDALALALALDPLVATRGMARLRLRLLDGAGDAGPDATEVAALIARAATARELGDLARARDELARADVRAEAAGLGQLRGLIGARLGELIEIGGDTAAARACFERALALLGESPREAALITTHAEIHARLAHALRREGELAAAREHIARATALYRAADHRAGVAAQAYEAGALALIEGAMEESRARFEESRAIAAALGDQQLEAANRSALGILAQAAGALDDAIAHHGAAVRVFRDLGNRHREGSALFYLAATHLERGEPERAIEVLDEAAAAIAEVGARRYQALIEGARAVALHRIGERVEARDALAIAQAHAAACASEPGLAATLAIHAETLRGDTDVRAAAERVRALAEDAGGDDAALAARLFAPQARRAITGALVIRAGGAAFRAPGIDDDIALPARSPLRRILATLARRRLDTPGAAVTADELVAAGWPDERIRPDAAHNRLHVALATLRKLGLRTLLITDERGYLLEPAVPVELG
jgi:tetratricopeptide (TPR) repeat protein